MTTIALRCSANDRVSECPPSAIAPAVRIDSNSMPARMGSALHEFMSDYIRMGDPCVEALAEKYDVDPADLMIGCGAARSAWKKFAEHFPNPKTEHQFATVTYYDRRGDEIVTLDGHCDLISTDGEPTAPIVIGDWKSGWSDSEHEQQMKGYAYLTLEENPDKSEVVAVIFKLKFGESQGYKWTREELRAWWESLASRVLDEQDKYRPSVRACGYCPRAHECPARTALVLSASRSLVALEPVESLPMLTPDELADLHGRAKIVATAAEMALDAIKATLIAAGGEIEATDGRRLFINEQVRTSIDYAAAEGVLQKALGSELPTALTVNKKRAVEIVRAGAANREKKKAEETFLDELDAADALRKSFVQRMEFRAGKPAAKFVEQTV